MRVWLYRPNVGFLTTQACTNPLGLARPNPRHFFHSYYALLCQCHHHRHALIPPYPARAPMAPRGGAMADAEESGDDVDGLSITLPPWSSSRGIGSDGISEHTLGATKVRTDSVSSVGSSEWGV